MRSVPVSAGCFPWERVYEEDGFHYFLQIHECHKENRSKVKVKKWIGIPEIKRYEAFVLAWHDYLKRVGDEVKHAAGGSADEGIDDVRAETFLSAAI